MLHGHFLRKMKAWNILILSITAFGFIANYSSGKRIPSFAGPFKIICLKTNNETDEYKSTGDLWPRLYHSSPKPNQTQYVRGLYYSDIEVNDNMRIGLRHIANQTFEPTFPHFSILPYGHYLFTMAFVRDDVVVGISVTDGKAVPKF